ncbi:endonuclease/exonuclease/phosphatase family protein [Ancylobacter lacus]|uniref:endonuclease/exonuclease/phosphatase family protein n=1 Tax=Ancylobacter lacus TaxID=2579970 RepID=UPI001BCD2967|nr:endonuclease/exonuclease/phosphatase family protein [Ancylobacter lacus]MBS7540288.1 endonuclease/exonuclease/phosphatase family protein [Ancylobacter lacus]
MRTLLMASLVAAALLPGAGRAAEPTELTVMSFNIWGGGANAGKPVDETVAAIRAVGPDIIGVLETRPEPDPCDADNCVPTGPSVAREIAGRLGYYYYDQDKRNPALWAGAILSRYPIVKATENDLGVQLDVKGRKVFAYSLHLPDFPYQPYQLLGIEYGPAPFLKTADEAVAAAKAARGAGVDLFLHDLKEADGADAVFVFGDFNEPSHLDWTEAAVKAGRQPLAVAWPTSRRMAEEGGFLDLFRVAWPDPAQKPGMTWTTTTEPTDPADHHDRIDFTYGRGAGMTVLKAGIVGEKAPEADIVVTPWPSDHRATMATVRF